MLRLWTLVIGAVSLCAQPTQPASTSSPERALLNKYCITCHNDKLKTAGLSLQALNPERVGPDAAVWEKVVGKLRGAAMPPAGAPQPDKTAALEFASYLEAGLDRAAMETPNPGWTAIHRLNRAEYANSIRDVLSLDVDVSSLLPVDTAAYGFDNIATLLSMSPGLLDRYLSAARKISLLVIADPNMIPVFETYDVPRYLVQDERMSEDLPFGSRGGAAVHHYFPLDGEYVARVVASFSGRDSLEVRLDGVRVAGLKPMVGGGGNTSLAPVQEIRFAAKAGMHIVGLSFVDKTTTVEGVGPARVGGYGRTNAGVNRVEIGGPYNAIGNAETPSQRRIFVCQPATSKDETPCARKILTTLARRAYRRPVTDDDVTTLLDFYNAARSEDEGFEAGIRSALVRVLVSPDFLFRVERDPVNVAAGAHRLSDLELASRLSFFLWSSIPDEELLQTAEQGRLHEPATLEQQVRRMLSDARATALVSNFASQWLYLRNLRTATPDIYQFPMFDDNLRDSMRQETELFVGSQVREDRPLLDLLRANYTFLNERLARHYGIPNVYGSGFRRITLNDDRRFGLLGQASILTVTSYANRTSVVERGKWILENMLGLPTPAPPPNVPALPENTAAARPKSLRERMVQHRNNPSCAVCHAAMDPVGFALENFDAIGEWRTTDAGVAIDASGALPDGTKLNGPADLRRALLDRGDQFVAVVTDKLLTYALGRGVEYYDQPAIRKIMRDAAPSDYRWSALILGIVKSQPFQMRIAPAGPNAVASKTTVSKETQP
jgi:hypothetical protein